MALTTVGCVSASPPGAQVATAPSPSDNDAPHVERAWLVHAPVSRDTASLWTLPLVRGSVAGHSTLMAVDTGSGANVIAGWLARSLALETIKVNEPTHDPSGRPVVMQRDDQPHLAIDGFDPLSDRPTLVVDLPPAFEAAGIGVLLSPQMLASADRTLEIDLPARELRRVRANVVWLADHREKQAQIASSGNEICHPSDSGFGGKMLSATSVIDGIPTTLAVDTGALGNAFFLVADSDAGKKVLARDGGTRESGFSAAGKLDVTTMHEVPVRVGDKEWKTDVTVMPGRPDGCGTEGRLGLDYLNACVFSIHERSYELHCQGS